MGTIQGLRFVVDGERFTLAEMLDANEGDDATCDWCRNAAPGDCANAWQANRVDCIAVDVCGFEVSL